MEQEIKIPTEVYSRVVGYLRPVAWFNVGKKQEFKDRKTYSMKGAIRRMDDDKSANK